MQQKTKFKLRLDFISLVKFSTMIGLCFGVGSIPFVLLSNIGDSSGDATAMIIQAPFAIIGAPIVGVMNGALAGIIGYPLYKWLSSRVGIIYSGDIYVNE